MYLLLYPKGPLKTILARNPELEARIYDTLKQTTAEMFLGESRVYGGGLYKLEPKELSRLSAEPILKALPALKHQRTPRLFA